MIYEVKKDDVTFEVDDNLLFDSQPHSFRRLYNDLKGTTGQTSTIVMFLYWLQDE